MTAFIGKGKIYLGLKSGGVKRRIGNCSQFQFQVENDEKTLVDFENAGGGFAATLDRITGVRATLTLHDFSAENLALVLFGSTSAITAAAVVDESITSSEGGLTRTAFVIDTSVAPVVTSDPAGTTYTEDTDYTVSPAGIVTLAGGSIGDGTALLIDYTKLAVDVVETLVNAQQAYVITLDGLNEANSGSPVVIDIFNGKISPTQGLDVISDDFGAMEVQLKVEKDTAITTPGLSQYLKISKAA